MKAVFTTFQVMLLAASVWAQSDRGTLTGSVKDPAEAIVAGATVMLRNVATGQEAKTVTTESGNYTLTALPAGTYQLQIEAGGFKGFRAENVQIQVAQTTRVNATLEIGAATEMVTITAQSPLLKTETAEQSTNISGELFNALPNNLRRAIRCAAG